VGTTDSLRVLILVFTVRNEKIRAITGWDADRRTKKQYFAERDITTMARQQLAIPSFKSEKEEASWWQKHRLEVETGLRAAMREGKTVSLKDVLAQSARKKLLPVTIRLASEDIDTARQLADDKGVGYQTYIKLFLHEALQKESARRQRAR
jgi:predicted DNA binding CopG/RHH family protein